MNSMLKWTSNDRELKWFEEKQRNSLETQSVSPSEDESLKFNDVTDLGFTNTFVVGEYQNPKQVPSGSCQYCAHSIKFHLNLHPGSLCAKQNLCPTDFAYSADISLPFLMKTWNKQLQKSKKIVSHCQKQTVDKYKDLTSNFLRRIPSYQTLSVIFLIFLLQSSTAYANNNKRSKPFSSGFEKSISRRTLRFNQPLLLDRTTPEYGPRWLYPSVVNLASRAIITSNATCGLNRAVKYCKLVEHVDRRWNWRGKQCSMCDITSSSFSERHPIENAIDGRGDTWWQSPTIEQGYGYHWVTITLDLKQVFQIAYVIIKAANSPRPGNWVLEKSIDGSVWEPWQYFAVTDSECFKTYGLPSARFGAPKYRYDTEVMCTSYFSKLNPLENGEIYVSLINGRPSAENPSTDLMLFTSARFVRLRLQKIRTLHGDLMTSTSRFPGYADALVTRRYYYSMKDISIGGMCVCYGHASTCFANSSTGEYSCHCEHGTAGRNCETCAPGFNQYAWQPGNNGFKCEACNCHGHSQECRFDAEVAARRGSLNANGEYSGGGVCVGCKENTAGTNCETCIDGFYRPYGISSSDKYPCQPCICNVYGGSRVPGRLNSFLCTKKRSSAVTEEDYMPGDCICKPGYAGEKCDRCVDGYRGFPFCKPCPCNASGSSNPDACHEKCVCKSYVIGENCSECKSGFYNLQSLNPVGCDQCYCFGATNSCQSSSMRWSNIYSNVGWEVRVRGGRRKILAQLDSELHQLHVSHEHATQILNSPLYYWSAPREYLGPKLSSYGGYLAYVLSYEVEENQSAFLRQYPDVILEGSRNILIYNSRGIRLEPHTKKVVSVKLAPVNTIDKDLGWIDSTTRQPATKADFMAVLLNVKRLLIRAVYSRNMKVVYRIADVQLTSARTNGQGSLASSVEICQCPIGYTGNSCESCVAGYWRSGTQCLPCQCHGHAANCNLINGACMDCRHNTMGMHCERCKPGFYGDATWGTSKDCQSCACPLPIASNNFSPTCRLDRSNADMICLRCPAGYTGKKCEICDAGYFGEPAIPGGRCQPCQCNGNSESCERSTGRCLSCRNNTSGEHCDRCKTAYYGDASFARNCQPCDCNPIGSLTRQCNMNTGQCVCKRGIFGQKCDTCLDSQYLSTVAKTCVTCDCSTFGSVSQQCQADGNCVCKIGVEGQMCDTCSSGFYGFSYNGCKACECSSTNGNCDSSTGECLCPVNTRGFKCLQCTLGSFQWHRTSGCKNCNCSPEGTIEQSQCNNVTGECQCKSQYSGRKCDICKEGFYGYPNCKPCKCSMAGTLSSSCKKSYKNMCSCSNDGQCHCKANTVGKNCDVCAPKSFALSTDHPEGCTACYCSGVTDRCEQAQYVWGTPIFMDYASLKPINYGMEQLYTFFDSESVGNRMRAYFWRLPEKFNGDKTLSYGGKLRYVIRYDSEVLFYPELNVDSVVVLQSRESVGKTIQYKLENPITNTRKIYTIPMREFGWKNTANGRDVTRHEFSVILRNISLFLIKSSYGYTFNQSRLISVNLDVAVTGTPGRGDDTSEYPVAEGLEQCFCPPGYIGRSCQDCAPGFMRVPQGPLFGRCQPCNCNNRSNTCSIETGQCLNCAGNFVGENCESCKAGYYLASNECRRCQCPGKGPDNNFSPTCRSDNEYDELSDYTCNSCLLGYTGKHCEICADGYYGNPMKHGGFCAKCGCNVAGSVNALCDKATGQCNCDAGIQGRICDQCQLRHVITSQGCLKCQDGCVELLLDEIETLKNKTGKVVVNNQFPLPWHQLKATKNKTRMLELNTQLLQKKFSYWQSQQQKIEVRLSKAVKNVSEAFMYFEEVNTDNLTSFEKTYTSIKNAAYFCAENANAIKIKSKAIKARTKKMKSKSRNLLNEAQEFKSDIRKLLAQLENGTSHDATEMRVKVELLVEEIKQRNFSSFSKLAELDIKLTQQLLDSHIKNFTAKAREVKKDIEVEKQKLLDDLNVLFSKFNYTKLKFLDIDGLLIIAQRKNDMNRQSLSQTAGEIEKVQNLASNASGTIKHGKEIFKMAKELYQNGTVFLNMLTNEELIKSRLLEAKDKIQNRLLFSLNPPSKVLRAEVKRVEDHERLLRAKVDYINSEYRGVIQTSAKQREAATRWTSIAAAIDQADNLSVAAKKKAKDSLVSAQSNLGGKADASLLKSNQVHRSVSTLQTAINNYKQQLLQIGQELTSVGTSSDELNRKHNSLLSQLRSVNSGFMFMESPVTVEDIRAAVKRSKPTLSLVNGNLTKLQQTYQLLDVVYRKVQLQPETKNQAAKSLDAVPRVLKEIDEKFENVHEKSNRVSLLSDKVQRNISNIRKLIEDTKRKAASIRASVQTEGKCSMLYEPPIASSANTEIILNVRTNEPNNLLFYLARENKDFLAVETRDHHVRVTWDLGGGVGSVENPAQLLDEEKNSWYRIEIYRRSKNLNVTVYKTANKTETIHTVQGFSPGSFAVLNVDQNDLLYIGGVPVTAELPKSVIERSFAGCMGEVFIQGKSVGLWNFKAVSDANDCRGCSPSEPLRKNVEINLYSFTGKSHAVLSLPSNYKRDQTRFSFEFQTFSSEGLFFFLGSKQNPDFISLELLDGRLLLKLNLGEVVHITSTEKQYNDGKWTLAVVFRNQNNLILTLSRDKKRQERRKANFTTSNDTNLDLNSNDNLFVGGIPPESSTKLNVTKISFVGCVREFIYMRKILKLKEGSNSENDVLQETGVSNTCPAKVTRNIGISNYGYIEIPPAPLAATAFISMTFNTRKSNSILLFATTTSDSKSYRKKGQSPDLLSYALYLSGGQVHARIFEDGEVAINLASTQSYYDDGRAHSLSLYRKRDRWTLQMSDDQTDKMVSVMTANADRTILADRLFVGGLPHDFRFAFSHVANDSLNGCVRELVIDNLIDFKSAIGSKNAFFGTCQFIDFAPTPTVATPPHDYSSPGSFQSHATTPHPKDGSGFVIPRKKPNDPHCRTPGKFEVRKNSANFGSSPHSYLRYHLERKISESFMFEMKIRTFSDSGLLLFANHQSQRDFFALHMKDGKPLFQFDNGKGRAEVVGVKSINDGKWHKIRIRRNKRKGWLVVDKQKKKSVKSKKGANLMDVTNVLYVGGLPKNHDRKNLGQIYNSMDICIRDLTLNKNISLTPMTADSSFQVQSCFNKVTSGAHFNGTGFAIHKKSYRVGQNMLIEMDFRTWRSNGVILSVENNRVDGLAVEMVNGSIYIRADNGGGPYEAKFTFPLASGSNRKRTRYPLCDGRWHQLRAEKQEVTLHISVDNMTATVVTSTSSRDSADTNDPLYIGGIPENIQPPKLLRISDNFEGCIRNLRVKNIPISFDESEFRRGVFSKSCPTPRKRKKRTKIT